MAARISVLQIFEADPDKIIEQYARTNKLVISMRRKVVEIIVREILNKKIILKKKHLRGIAKQICKIFPTEKIVSISKFRRFVKLPVIS